MGSDEKIGTIAELDHAEAAIEEMERQGSTERRCLRCGGQYVLEDYGSAYVIRCQNCDFSMTSRGL